MKRTRLTTTFSLLMIFKGEKTVEEMAALSERYEIPVTVKVVTD